MRVVLLRCPPGYRCAPGIAVGLAALMFAGACDGPGPAPAALATAPPVSVRRARPTPPVDTDAHPGDVTLGGGPRLPESPDPAPLAAGEHFPPAWPADVGGVLSPSYDRHILGGAPLVGLGWDAVTDTLLAVDTGGGLHMQRAARPWTHPTTTLDPGVTWAEIAGSKVLACAGSSAPARLSLDGGATFHSLAFTCGEGGRRTAAFSGDTLHVLVSPDTLGRVSLPRFAMETRPLPVSNATALAADGTRLAVFAPGRAFFSVDAGESFAESPFPSDGPDVRDAAFLPKGRVVALGDAAPGSAEAASLVLANRAEDGFFAPPDLPRHGGRLGRLAVSAAHVLAVPESRGDALFSVDGGQTFTLAPAGAAWQAVAGPARGGFAAGVPIGSVGGLDGAAVVSLPIDRLRGAVFLHPRLALAVDARGDLLESTDRGRNFRPLAWAHGLGLTHIARLDDAYALALGGASGLWIQPRLDAPARRLDAGCAPRFLRSAPEAGRGVAGCADGTLRLFSSVAVSAPLRAPAPTQTGDFQTDGTLVLLGADGRRLFTPTDRGGWRARTVGAPTDSPLVDLRADVGGLRLLRVDGATIRLTRFDGAPILAGVSLPAWAGEARSVLPLSGGGELVLSSTALYANDAGASQGAVLLAGLADASGVALSADGTLLVFTASATTVLAPN